MNTFMQRIGITVAGVLAAVSTWGCAATRNADGSVTIKFAPDMVVTALGLEGALKGVNELLRDCIRGTFPRPCTQSEIDAIRGARRDILRAKKNLLPPPMI